MRNVSEAGGVNCVISLKLFNVRNVLGIDRGDSCKDPQVDRRLTSIIYMDCFNIHVRFYFI